MELLKWEKPKFTAGSSDYTPSYSAALLSWHNAGLLKHFDSFKCIFKLPWMCVWSGSLTPVFQTYDVRIAFVPGFNDGTLNFAYGSVTVWVTNPILVRRVSEPDVKIPHLYEQPLPDQPPKLCLYLPSDNDWNTLSPIADYIVPWISEWLLNYELWHVTGHWASVEAPHNAPKSGNDATIKKSDGPLGTITTPLLTSAFNRLKSTTGLQNLPYIVQKYCPITNFKISAAESPPTPPPSATPQ